MSRLSSLGTGLLLGAALGIIIPEYVSELCLARHPRRAAPITAF
jgi:hypothetical protein